MYHFWLVGLIQAGLSCAQICIVRANPAIAQEADAAVAETAGSAGRLAGAIHAAGAQVATFSAC